MTELKRRVMLEEIKEYLEYDTVLDASSKEELLQLNSPFMNSWMQVVYDYFYSHIDDEGNVLSLENYLLKVEKRYIFLWEENNIYRTNIDKTKKMWYT